MCWRTAPLRVNRRTTVATDTLRSSTKNNSSPGAAATRGRWSACLVTLTLALAALLANQTLATAEELSNSLTQSQGTVHQAVFMPGASFQVGEVPYPSAHDFDAGDGVDTCLSVSVPPADTFTLSLSWEALFDGPPGAGDLDLYLYSDSNCTASALLTSSFNSNAYTGELLEITPQVRNIGSVTAIGGVRIGKRSGRGNPGLLRLSVQTGAATFAEHGTVGPPLTGQEGAPSFTFSGPFTIAENSPAGSPVGTVTAVAARSGPITFFELEPASNQTTFQIHPLTGAITVQDSTDLDREISRSLTYWIGATDGQAAAVISVGVNLTGVNDNAPVTVPVGVSTSPDTPFVITLTGADADVDPAQQLVLRIVSPPANGSLGPLTQLDGVSAATVYTPGAGFIGTDTFSFEASDGVNTSAPATVTITVTDQPPTPTPTAASTPAPTASPGAAATSAPTPPVQSAAPGATPTPTAAAGDTGGLVPILLPTPLASQIPVVPPSAPRFLRASPGDTSVTFSWQRPQSDGGEPIAGYRIFNINTARSAIFQGDITSAQLFGLENGVAYLFQVRAFNSAGLGDSDLVGLVTPVSKLPARIDAQSSLHPDDSVTVWWPPPSGPHVASISEYRVWREGGELRAVLTPDEPSILNITGLEGDSWHVFRVTAFGEDGDVVASGLTEALYIPPTLASRYEPLPADAILVDLTEETRAELQDALRLVAGGGVQVPDRPLALTLRDGKAELYLEVEGLHRAVVFPPGFMVASEQWTVTQDPDEGLVIDLEIAGGVRIAADGQTQIDRTGVLFQLPQSGLIFRPEWPDEAELAPVERVEIDYGSLSLSPGFSFDATVPVELPVPLSEELGGPNVEDVAAVIEISQSGLLIAGPVTEHVRFEVETRWHESQLADGRTVTILRLDSAGLALTSPAVCEPLTADGALATGLTSCRAVLDGEGGPVAHYALISGTPGKKPAPTPAPTPLPTPLSAPSDEPSSNPVPGPSLVVVEDEPSPVPTPAPSTVAGVPSPAPAPQATATAEPPLAPPVLPEPGGGGASVVTWLMSGLLGLVVLRGAFYAVGRIKS